VQRRTGAAVTMIAAALVHSRRRPIAVAIVTACWLATVATTPGGDRAKALAAYRDGLRFEQEHRASAAISAYAAAAAADSTLPETQYRMGVVLAGVDRLREAIVAFRRELKVQPGHAGARRELGQALARSGSPKEAVTVLEALTADRDDDDQAWQALAFAYSLESRPPDAEQALRRAIELPPDRASEHRDLGVVLTTLGRDAEAREEYRAAIALDETDAGAWVNLGNLERRAGRFEDALAAYQGAEAADSTSALAMQGQMQALESLGRRDESLSVALRWLRQRPDDHNARVQAIRILQEAGRDEDALQVARNGVRRNPRSGDARVVLSTVLASQGDTRGALRELRAADRLFTDPINRGFVRNLKTVRLAAASDSIRALATADSLAEEAQIREAQQR